MAESTSDDQFRILQRDIREAIRRNHPNPERIGCPGSETLRKMAEAAVPPSDPGYRHVMECSPCYEELMDLAAATEARRSEDTSHRRRRALVIAITVALVVVGIGAYVLIKGGAPPFQQPSDQVAGGSGAKQPSPKRATADGLSVAMLNLDSETSVRSTGEKRQTTELQRLPRERLDLTINLPRGLEAGKYELTFSRDDAPPLLTLTGQARIEDGLTVLHLRPDLSGLAPGQYKLRIRREGSAWRESQVLLF